MFNKDLGTIRLIVGNKGPRISVGTYVSFSNMDKLIIRGYTATHGTYADGIWQIDLLDVGEYAEIYIEVDNQSSGQVEVNCEIHGDYFDPDLTNNIYTYYIGRTDNIGNDPNPEDENGDGDFVGPGWDSNGVWHYGPEPEPVYGTKVFSTGAIIPRDNVPPLLEQFLDVRDTLAALRQDYIDAGISYTEFVEFVTDILVDYSVGEYPQIVLPGQTIPAPPTPPIVAQQNSCWRASFRYGDKFWRYTSDRLPLSGPRDYWGAGDDIFPISDLQEGPAEAIELEEGVLYSRVTAIVGELSGTNSSPEWLVPDVELEAFIGFDLQDMLDYVLVEPW